MLEPSTSAEMRIVRFLSWWVLENPGRVLQNVGERMRTSVLVVTVGRMETPSLAISELHQKPT